MVRLCTCDRFTKGSAYDTSQCRLCWLYYHDVEYREHWQKSNGHVQRTLPCLFKGAETRVNGRAVTRDCGFG
jgi:hypothetical protein